jgi:hypothetical protein
VGESPYGPTDDTAARKLVRLCLEQSPDAKVTEVVAVIHEKGPLAKTRETAAGFLLKAVPKQFEPIAFATWRRDRKNTADRLAAEQRRADTRDNEREAGRQADVERESHVEDLIDAMGKQEFDRLVNARIPEIKKLRPMLTADMLRVEADLAVRRTLGEEKARGA